MPSTSSFGDFNIETIDTFRYEPVNKSSKPLRWKNSSFWSSTTARILHLIIFGILMPMLCIVLPVYAKFVLYADNVVTFGASDMRLVDGHMSTTWCQSQNVKMNASFDAYLMSQTPPLTPKAQKLTMTRHFELDDDLKEYWGFYLLKGSEVTVSSCARYLGANVMLIKGISSLKFCAYVGQESREDVSKEIMGLEEHKLLEQYEMADPGPTGNINKNFKAPPPPLFSQPNKKDKDRIMQLIKARNEKRRIIKLLERQNINSNKNDSRVSAGIVAQVEEALQKILQQEIQSLYQEVKNIIFSNNIVNDTGIIPHLNANKTSHNSKKRWPLKSLDPAKGSAKLSAVITEEVDVEEDGAYEMDDSYYAGNLTSDGIADDKGTIDHNHANDTSQSFEESSFSSSEEAMLHCNGVLLSQPLVPENRCSRDSDPNHNQIKYVVEEDGYYYFIFSSANEKVRNQLTVKFNLLKTVFNVTEATDICHNTTDCQFPLHFYSSERVVVSLPAPVNNSSTDWDKTFVAQSICEPRMPLYLLFVLILPISVLFCALR